MRFSTLGAGSVLLSSLCATSHAYRLPQIPFSPSDDSLGTSPHPPPGDWNPLEHMSGIAPYHDAPGADITPPDGCEVTSVAFLVRHSCIYANDDEWADFMEPFVNRLEKYQQEGGSFQGAGPLAFLENWESPINEDNLEALTGPGADDAFAFGKRLRKLYPHLFPPKDLGKGSSKGKKGRTDKVKEPFRIWTANSNRDVGTAKAFIKGAFPKRHEGDDGEGDGKYLSLIKVNNKEASWSSSLTPHKVCPAFTKEPGKPDAQEWLEHFGVAPLERLKKLMPNFEWALRDVIALMMLCGYESVIKGVGRTEFCKQGLFTAEEYSDFGYWNDLIYHKMTGYAAPVAPYLGIPWVNTSLHNLLEAPEHRHHRDGRPHLGLLKEGDGLPDPDRPPNATHSQSLFVFFTHREEPPVALVALGIWNQTTVGPLPTDRRPDNRVWKTSHVLPFLGHVAIEKLTCGSHKHPKDYARILVNGAAQPLPREDLADGPGKSCRMERFTEYVRQRMEMFGDFEGACKKAE